jgi:hypothetical protein
MPTLDDLPTLATASPPSGNDLIPVYEPNVSGSSKVRKLPLNSLLGIAPTGEITAVAAGTRAISTRVLFINSGSTSTLTLPAASGELREVFVINGGSGTAAISTLASGHLAAQSNILTATSAHFLSNGTSWYRVG